MFIIAYFNDNIQVHKITSRKSDTDQCMVLLKVRYSLSAVGVFTEWAVHLHIP